ncbi:MAG: GLPGLI family protein [Bacteroidaceae bacterium]|nr:GLPGLI family protein [Bacteroidaceae bacterium]
MKRIFTLMLAFLAVCGEASAQWKQSGAIAPWNHNTVVRRKAIDTANMRILYAWNADNIKEDSTYLDLGQLQIGKRVTKYSSLFVEQANDERIKWHKANPRAQNVPSGGRWMRGKKPDAWSEYQYSHIFIHGDTLNEWAVLPPGQDWPLRYEEKIVPFGWKLGTETQVILGHKCQRATCHWRGRDYVAWFAPDIPIRRGPWKFGGLPGLILKIYDTDRLYTFEAVAIEKGSFSIWQYPKEEFKKATRKQTWKLQVAYNRNYLLASGRRKYDPNAPGFMGEPMSAPHKYDPMELE